jgi:uncharacterized sporulation protein YeaH/YhbH (DUF444 family)
MTVFIDRRFNSGGKNLANRQRFLRRCRRSIRQKMEKIIEQGNLKEINASETIVPVDMSDINEYHFSSKPGLDQHFVLVGNEEYVEGDKIPKSGAGGGRGGAGAGHSGTGDLTDDFEFVLSKEEFLDFFFEDLELPNLTKTQLKKTSTTKSERYGISTTGNQSNINLERTFRQSLGRRMALKRPCKQEIESARSELEKLLLLEDPTEEQKTLMEYFKAIIKKSKRIPFFDEKDLRYNRWEQKPKPTTSAVMFCLMDVSGSMGQHQKDIAKRFFLLLYIFLQKAYKDVEIIFIRHTEVGEEVDEKTFFYGTASGGTVVSSGLDKVLEIIHKTYPPQDYNIYIAQASDGDNISSDNIKCVKLLKEQLLPVSQYFAYIETKTPSDASGELPFYNISSTLWPAYAPLESQHENFVCRQVRERSEIWSVFKDLFQK